MEKAKYFSDDDWSIGRALERAEKNMNVARSAVISTAHWNYIIFKSCSKSEQNSRIGAKSIFTS